MYKYLLCWRYLRTRFIALASIVSVTLGVATMIVVNAVMAGFTHEMQDRIRGILSDVTFEARSFEGMADPAEHMRRIRQVAGDQIESMTATAHTPAMLSFRVHGKWFTRPVQLLGIEAATKSEAGAFGEYLLHPENRRQFAFDLREKGYDTRDTETGDGGTLRVGMDNAGWAWRRERARREKLFEQRMERIRQGTNPLDAPLAEDEVEGAASSDSPADPFAAGRQADPFKREEAVFDPATQQHTGCVVGVGLVSFRQPNPETGETEEHFLALPGDDIQLTFPTAGAPPKAVSDNFTIVDLYFSKMSEYDSSFVFVPIEKLQALRGMIEPQTGRRFISSIQIKLKPGADGAQVRDALQAVFPARFYNIQTWRDKQGPLLAAVQMETLILNILLFLIIAVAGFGILAIFFMIVVEKTKDIGILKSLGAGRGGVMGIFLSYGLSLGLVGAGVGLGLGLAFVHYINDIADALAWLTGQEVFDPSIYYFDRIPTVVDPFTVIWIGLGAVGIAILASVLPAGRAARLHPVQALRYE